MAVTLKEVAKRAGVSRSAVSRTFTAGASVSPKMRARVEAAAQELGYSPNALASSLTTGRTKLIGLVSNNFENPIFLQFFDLFTRGLQEKGLRPLLVNLSDETAPDASVRMLRQYSVDGVIVASSTLPMGFSVAFKSADIPVVHAFGRPDQDPDVHVVGIDNIASGRRAVRTLYDRGYRNIAFLGGPESATSTQDRLNGFKAEAATLPDLQISSSFADAYSFDAGHAEMARLIAQTPAEAYFCGDDIVSIGAISAIRDSGLNCPDDIGILGLNDMEMARWNIINLTTISQPIPDIVDASIQMMIALLDDARTPPEARVFDSQVIERGTLRPLPA